MTGLVLVLLLNTGCAVQICPSSDEILKPLTSDGFEYDSETPGSEDNTHEPSVDLSGYIKQERGLFYTNLAGKDAFRS